MRLPLHSRPLGRFPTKNSREHEVSTRRCQIPLAVSSTLHSQPHEDNCPRLFKSKAVVAENRKKERRSAFAKKGNPYFLLVGLIYAESSHSAIVSAELNPEERIFCAVWSCFCCISLKLLNVCCSTFVFSPCFYGHNSNAFLWAPIMYPATSSTNFSGSPCPRHIRETNTVLSRARPSGFGVWEIQACELDGMALPTGFHLHFICDRKLIYFPPGSFFRRDMIVSLRIL